MFNFFFTQYLKKSYILSFRILIKHFLNHLLKNHKKSYCQVMKKGAIQIMRILLLFIVNLCSMQKNHYNDLHFVASR